jgi:hypothetical protein
VIFTSPFVFSFIDFSTFTYHLLPSKFTIHHPTACTLHYIYLLIPPFLVRCRNHFFPSSFNDDKYVGIGASCCESNIKATGKEVRRGEAKRRQNCFETGCGPGWWSALHPG